MTNKLNQHIVFFVVSIISPFIENYHYKRNKSNYSLNFIARLPANFEVDQSLP